jgi:hypothetical protein
MDWNQLQCRLKPTGYFMSLMHIFPENIAESDDDTPSAENDKEMNVILSRLGWLNCWYSYVSIDASCGVCAPVSSLKGFNF